MRKRGSASSNGQRRGSNIRIAQPTIAALPAQENMASGVMAFPLSRPDHRIFAA